MTKIKLSKKELVAAIRAELDVQVADIREKLDQQVEALEAECCEYLLRNLARLKHGSDLEHRWGRLKVEVEFKKERTSRAFRKKIEKLRKLGAERSKLRSDRFYEYEINRRLVELSGGREFYRELCGQRDRKRGLITCIHCRQRHSDAGHECL